MVPAPDVDARTDDNSHSGNSPRLTRPEEVGYQPVAVHQVEQIGEQKDTVFTG